MLTEKLARQLLLIAKFDIVTPNTIKGQVIIDNVAKLFANQDTYLLQELLSDFSQYNCFVLENEDSYKVYFDGFSTKKLRGARLIIINLVE